MDLLQNVKTRVKMSSKIFILFILIQFHCYAEEKINYQYKQYEKIDLGSLEVKGGIVAPGDLTVKERSRIRFKRSIYERKNFNKEITKDLKYIR